MTRFNLIDEPWIPVLTGPAVRNVSLREAFTGAEHLGVITGQVPTQTLALYRLLGAVLHAAVRPVVDPVREWGQLWSGTSELSDIVEAYLDRPDIHARFDLLDRDQPFYQMPGMHYAPERKAGEPSKNLFSLIPDLPSGNNVAAFSSRTPHGVAPMSFAEAARWVVHVHFSDLGGIKSPMAGQSEAKMGKIYASGEGRGAGWGVQSQGFIVEGDNLRETLLLNLMLGNPISGAPASRLEDVPAWERPQTRSYHDIAGPVRPPDGPVDMATWQSRRVLLEHDGTAVIAAYLTYGDSLSVDGTRAYLDPNTAWKRKDLNEGSATAKAADRTYYSARHSKARTMWGGVTAMLIAKDHEHEFAAGATVLRPMIFDWLDLLQNSRTLDRKQVIHVRALGVLLNKDLTKIEDDVDDTLSVQALTLSGGGQAQADTLGKVYTSASAALKHLAFFAYNAQIAGGGQREEESSKKAARGRKSNTYVEADMRINQAFRAWVADVVDQTDDDGSDLQTWYDTARRILLTAGDQILAAASPRALFVGRTDVDKNSQPIVTLATTSHRTFTNSVYVALPRIDESITRERNVQ